jgi:hypothetical protein
MGYIDPVNVYKKQSNNPKMSEENKNWLFSVGQFSLVFCKGKCIISN